MLMVLALTGVLLLTGTLFSAALLARNEDRDRKIVRQRSDHRRGTQYRELR